MGSLTSSLNHLSNGVAYAPAIGDDLSLDYFLADMTGDGMPDQVSIKNGQVVYYPNLGNGHFGESDNYGKCTRNRL